MLPGFLTRQEGHVRRSGVLTRRSGNRGMLVAALLTPGSNAVYMDPPVSPQRILPRLANDKAGYVRACSASGQARGA